MKQKNKKAFTLIELLIVIAIIGILASIVLVSLNSARNKANAASYKSTISSVVPAIASCCDDSTNALQNSEGVDICSVVIGSNLPTISDLKLTGVTYTVTNDCNTTDPTITITPVGHPLAACNADVDITSSGVVTGGVAGFPAGC